MSLRHFLTLSDLSKQELETLIKRASELRKMQHAGEIYQPFVGRTLGMIFEKSSTRTRISFETGMGQFGGSAIFLSPNDTQLGRGEPLEDSARVISSMVDIIMIRTFGHEKVETFAKYSSVPIINALTTTFTPVSSSLICKPSMSIAAVSRTRPSLGSAMVIICAPPLCKRRVSSALSYAWLRLTALSLILS